jgi:hypothetical protein
MLRRLLFVLVVLLGCRAQSPSTDVCGHVSSVYLDPRFTSLEREDIDRAADAWSRATPECFRPESDPRDADVRIMRAADRKEVPVPNPDHIAGLWESDHRRIWIVTEAYSDDEKATIAAHELGHYFGLDHNQVALPRESIIEPDIQNDFPLVAGADLPPVDVASYWALRGGPPPRH